MKRKYRFTPENIIMDFVIAVFMLVITVVTFYPFLYIVLYSLSTPGRIGTHLLLWPRGFTLEAYKVMITSVPEIPHAFFVSVARTVIGPFLSVLVTSMCAYVLSRRDLLFRSFLLKIITITMYFTIGLIPGYLLIQNLHLAGTFWVYILPNMFNVFNMLLIKTYIESLPDGLQESAFIDGANDYTLFFRIVFPVITPVIAAVLLFCVVREWNMYYDTLLYNSMNKKLHTLQYVLMLVVQSNTASLEQAKQAMKQSSINSTTLKMALTVVTVFPILFVYPALQKRFVSGILIGSIKG